jgi:rod shape-determining protein MreD
LPVTPAAKARLYLAVVAVGALYLEVTFNADLRIWGVAPDLLGLVTVAAGLAGGPEQGALCGFGCGLLADVYLQDTPFGLSALTLCLIGFVVGTFRVLSPVDSKLLTPLVVALSTALAAGLFLALAGLFGQAELADEGRAWLIRVVVIESLDAAVLSLPVCWLVRRVTRGSPGAVALGEAPAASTR